jgi:DNA-binding transcriptional LysR family regulator
MTKSRSTLLMPRQLEAVVAVARTGSVHAASRELGIPQPAVSRLVAATEKTLGVTLFARSRSGTQLPDPGARVLKQVTFALHAREDIEEAAQQPEPVVRLGCIPRVMHVLIPHLLSQLGDGDSGFRLMVSVGTSSELAADLEDAKLDFIIARRASGGGAEFDGEDLYNERTVVVGGRQNKLVPKGPCAMSQLARLQWVLPKRGFYSRDLIDAIMQTAGQHPIVPVIETNSFESSLSVVAATQFIGIVPEFAARRFEQLKLVRIVPTRPSLGSSPVTLQYRAGQMAHPAYPRFRAAVERAARLVHGA